MKIAKLFFLIVFYAFTSFAADQSLYQKKPAFYAYIFGSLNSEQVDKECCADVLITPASCQKIIMTLLAYSYLGTDYQYETKVYRSINSNDIVISFVGDPTLTRQDLLELLEPLKHELHDGKIVIDLSLWNADQFSPFFMGEDRATNYCRPVLPAIINKNAIECVCELVDNAVRVENDSGYPINNNIIIEPFLPSSVVSAWQDSLILLSGTMNCNQVTYACNIIPHDGIEYIKKQVAIVAALLGIDNQVVVVSDPTDLGEMMCVNGIKSKPLHMIIESALQTSDNLVFDALYFTILTKYLNNRVTDWNQGDVVIKDLLKRYFGVDADAARFVDGSGLSRLNKISLRTLFMILKKGYFIDRFVDGLPVPGKQNTTLARRQKLPPTLRAKTGTLGGITCLCGYNLTDDPTVFCFVAQGFPSPLADMIDTVDQWICAQVS